MIKSIQIKNFQSHKDSVLEFDPGVNVIIGRSDSGKTAILRALNWLLTNKPAGDAFRSTWGGDTLVTVELDDGKSHPEYGNTVVYRLKSDKKNAYAYGNELLGPLEEFKAFGQNVPEEIAKILNVNSINIQYQMDAPFLLSSSPGEIAQYLNQIVNLDIIDLAMYNINKTGRATTQSIKTLEQEVQDLEEQVGNYTHIDKLDTTISDLESMQTKVKDLRSREASINSLLHDVEIVSQKVHKIKSRLNMEKPLDALFSIMDKKNELGEEQIKLLSIVNSIKDTKKRITIHESNLKNLDIEFHNKMPDLCPLCGQRTKK